MTNTAETMLSPSQTLPSNWFCGISWGLSIRKNAFSGIFIGKIEETKFFRLDLRKYLFCIFMHKLKKVLAPPPKFLHIGTPS